MGIMRRGGKAGKAGKAAKQATRYWGIAPSEPTITSVTRVGYSWSNAQYDIAFNPGTGVGATATSFTISAFNPTRGTLTFTATSSPHRISGLAGGSTWTFKIKANASIGQSNTETSSNEIEGGSDSASTVPDTPTAPVATSPSGASYDTVTWVAPDNGGSAILEYGWESSDGKSGTTSSLSVNVTQEQGTSQTYRVRARNANGWSEWSGSSSGVTTFSFVPFNAFNNFSPFNNFNNFVAFNNFNNFVAFNNFNNFSAFGNFSPFNNFNNFNNFSPFGPFSNFSPFSPFGPFSPFSPFGAFGFFAGCVEANTLVATVGPDHTTVMVPAKDVVEGTQVWAPHFDELQDESITDPYTWTSPSLTNVTYGISTVRRAKESTKTSVMTINGHASKKYSLEQGILVKRNNQLTFIVSGQLAVGDIVFAANYETQQLEELPVTSLEIIEGEHQVYQFDTEPGDVFFAGNLLMHNLKYY